jgi:flagellar protein FlaG
MNPHPEQPTITMIEAADYHEAYSNSVQVRVSVWDFFLAFGRAVPENGDHITIRNQVGVYLSPQQAKALWNVLGQNLAQYEQTFGTLTLEPLPQQAARGPVH